MVLIAAVALVVIPSADVPNSDYPEARAVADRLDSAWRSIGDGADAGETATAAGLVVATFEVAGRSVIVLSDSRPTTTGVCYAFRFGQGVLSEAGVVTGSSSGCSPDSLETFDRGGSWSDVLPSERITRPWFVPVMVLLVALGLFALADIPIAWSSRREAGGARSRR